MKRAILILTGALLLAACCGRQENSIGRDEIRNADLLFVGIPADYSLDTTSMSSAIADATGKEGKLNIIHVAILERQADSVFIIDATLKRGVARYPLDTFLVDFTLKDGSLPSLKVARLPKEETRADDCSRYISNAKKYIGRDYDLWFLPDNEAKYCSELVRDSYLGADGSFIFDAAPMSFRDSKGELPLYWEQLFASLGVPVPEGLPGTNPQDMLGCGKFAYIYNLDATK